MKFFKFLFTVFGCVSLALLLRNYGFSTLVQNLTLVGWHVFPLALTFIPTLLCYSLAWLLVTDCSNAKSKVPLPVRFFFMMVTSIAWNNLSPFIKVLGEPIKAAMLSKHIERKSAIKSVVIYNIVHLIGTVGAFLLAAILIPFLFPVNHDVRLICFILVGVCLFLVVLLLTLPQFAHALLKKKSFQKLRAVSLSLRWSFHKIHVFYRRRHLALILAILLEIAARFLEGLTFYYAFILLGEPISALSAAFLDVGRALADNVFFFIPYQVGSREIGVRFLLEKVLAVPVRGAVTVALLYRMVEIFWMILGYILWTREGSSAKSLK